MTDARTRVIEAARAEIGPQTKGSPRVTAYWRAVLPESWTDAQVAQYSKTRDWCGGFALWCLHQAGIGLAIRWKDGIGFLGTAGLKRTTTPSRGDVGYLDKPFQHHLLFEREHDGWIYSIDGNQPDVREKRRRRQGLVFYSIEPLLGATETADTDPAPPRPTLRLDATGADVVTLQQLLNGSGASLVTDGAFGPKTAAAVMSFQRRAGLDADGIVGPKTWAALEAYP